MERRGADSMRKRLGLLLVGVLTVSEQVVAAKLMTVDEVGTSHGNGLALTHTMSSFTAIIAS